MNLISNNIIDSKIIELRDKFIIIDRDVAELYGVETKRVNEAVSNNIDKFPKDYMFELTKDEKSKVVEYFDHLETIKYSPYLPKAFTKKGLWMLATILSSKKAKEVTFLIIETFEKIDNLKYNLKQLETTTDNKLKEQLSQKSGEIIAELLEVPEEYDADTETSIEVNFGLLKYKLIFKFGKTFRISLLNSSSTSFAVEVISKKIVQLLPSSLISFTNSKSIIDFEKPGYFTFSSAFLIFSIFIKIPLF